MLSFYPCSDLPGMWCWHFLLEMQTGSLQIEPFAFHIWYERQESWKQISTILILLFHNFLRDQSVLTTIKTHFQRYLSYLQSRSGATSGAEWVPSCLCCVPSESDYGTGCVLNMKKSSDQWVVLWTHANQQWLALATVTKLLTGK